MTPDEFRRHGHEVVEWVATYMERVAELPIAPAVEPGEIRAKLPPHAPEAPEPFEALMRDLDEIVLPGITHWQSPGLVLVLPRQRVAAVGPGRARVGRARGAGDDLVLEPGADGDRGARARLARRPARPAGALQDRDRARRRRDPDERVGLHAPRARDRARRGDPLRRRARRARRLRLLAGALLGRARREHRRLRPRAQAGRRRRVRAAARGAAAGDRAGPRRRPAPRDRHERDRDDRHRRRGPDRRRRRHRARARPVAPRRRRLGGLGDALRGAPPEAGGRRAGRQLHVQPAQVAVHQLRLQRAVGGRPRAAAGVALDPAAVPAQRGHGVRRGDRLPRLARLAGPPLPRPEAVVGAAQLRRRGPARAAARAHRARRGARPPRRRAPAAGARRAGLVLARVLPPRRRQRGHGRARRARSTPSRRWP